MKEISADSRFYTVGPKGKSKRWNVYTNRPGRVAHVYSEHATEAAAVKMAARRNAEIHSHLPDTEAPDRNVNTCQAAVSSANGERK